MRAPAEEMVLVNRRRIIAEGEAMDLQHASAFIPRSIRVRAGDLEDTAGSAVVILTCSIKWEPTFSSRMQLGEGNARLFAQIVPQLASLSPDAVFIIITNPVDVMTWHTIRLSGLPPQQVIGAGTLIDSGRLRSKLSEELGIHPDDLRAYILGEHGDSQFAAMSLAMAGAEFIPLTDRVNAIASSIANQGVEVFNRKGHTCYAISIATSLIVEAVMGNTCQTMPVSALLTDYMGIRDVCLSVPAVVGAGGIQRLLQPKFSDDELARLKDCARVVRQAIDQTLPITRRP